MTIVLVTHPREKLDQYFGQSAISALRTFSTVRFNPEARDLSTEELITLGADCDVIIAYRQTPGTASLFRGLPRLSAFMRCAVDIRTIDVDAASAQGILITQASAGYVPAVAEWAIAAMIDLGRGLTRYAEGYHHRHPVAPFMGRQLRGSTLGVIGYGQIGRYLADLALALGMQVCVTDPLNIERRDNLQQLDLDTTLSTADFVVCLAPANAQTENLMNAQAFARMKPGAFFINASRGDLVDERALLQSLESGHLAGCALDVGRESQYDVVDYAGDQYRRPKGDCRPCALCLAGKHHCRGYCAGARCHRDGERHHERMPVELVAACLLIIGREHLQADYEQYQPACNAEGFQCD